MRLKLLKLTALAFFLILFSAIIQISFATSGLLELARESLDKSGVDYLVTAVVLNFRGFDTMFEIFVLALAFLGTLILSDKKAEPLNENEPILNFFSSILIPLVLMVALFILYSGAYSAGGAFQASALIAGGLILSYLAGKKVVMDENRLKWKFSFAIGLFTFVSIATIGIFNSSMLNFYSSGVLLLLLESTLTITISYILFSLYLRVSL